VRSVCGPGDRPVARYALAAQGCEDGL